MFGTMISDMMVKPHQSPLFDNPGDYDLDFEDVEFQASDGVILRGWLVKGGTDKVIVQSHFGVQCNRAGYDPKGKGLIKLWKTPITFLRQAKYLVEHGYSVLLYDFRNHGASEVGTTPWITWGAEEAKDVIAAVDFVANQRPEFEGASIGLLGICMGGSATTYAFSREDGLRNYPNVKALIAVQPLPYTEFVEAFGLPGFLARAGAKVTVERTGMDLNDVRVIPEVKNINVPTLVMQNRNDPWSTPEVVERFFAELNVPKELKWVELEKSRGACYDYIGREPAMLVDWFDRHLGD